MPERNLAIEESLMFQTAPGECILYLWQNEKTVVIGRNQDCFEECRVEHLLEDGGHLVRRLSGGGAVFHDLGNLNFTFCVRKSGYDVGRQTEVILRAVKKCGIDAVRTGRNDLTADGKKFSGNAFYRSGDFCYHHGTILLDVDQEKMKEYLNVPESKLKAHGVRSVRSRTVNLKDLMPELTVVSLKQALIASFGEVYEGTPESFCKDRLDLKKVALAEQRFASDDWKFGSQSLYESSLSRRFSWGNLEIRFTAESGKITRLKVYTDAMDETLSGQLEELLTGCPCEPSSLSARAGALRTKEQIREEIQSWLSQG